MCKNCNINMKTKVTKIKKIKNIKKNKKIKETNKQEHTSYVSIIESYKTNWLSYLVFLVAAVSLSAENMLLGISLANFSFFYIYVSHIFCHNELCPLYYIHKYHHEISGWFSQLIEILLELFLFMLLSFILPANLCNEWIIMFSALLYISIHIMNYGFLHINNVHVSHHRDMNTNFSPDFYDVFFGTKHPFETEVENTNHYIPNIIIVFIVVYLFQQVCKHKQGFYENYRCIFSWLFKFSIVFFALFLSYILTIQ
jgi:hypothetical protein